MTEDIKIKAATGRLQRALRRSEIGGTRDETWLYVEKDLRALLAELDRLRAERDAILGSFETLERADDRLHAELIATRTQFGEALDEAQRLRSENDRLHAGVREAEDAIADSISLIDRGPGPAAPSLLHTALETLRALLEGGEDKGG